MTYEHDSVILTSVTDDFQVNLSDQRTRGVNHLEPTFVCRFADGRGHSVGAKDNHCACGYLIERLHKNGSPRGKVFNHVAIMDNLLAHIHGPAQLLQCQLYNLDRPNYPGTKSPRLHQQESWLIVRGQVFSFSGPGHSLIFTSLRFSLYLAPS